MATESETLLCWRICAFWCASKVVFSMHNLWRGYSRHVSTTYYSSTSPLSFQHKDKSINKSYQLLNITRSFCKLFLYVCASFSLHVISVVVGLFSLYNLVGENSPWIMGTIWHGLLLPPTDMSPVRHFVMSLYDW